MSQSLQNALPIAALLVVAWLAAYSQPHAAETKQPAGVKLKTESFDRDPGWEGINNRSAQKRQAIKTRQDFGYSPGSRHAGGQAVGEIGGYISPAGEAAFYGKQLTSTSFEKPLKASGVLSISPGGTHLLLGFFNSHTVHEWRTPNTVALRLHGRGENFFAYVEYCTSKWRAGGDTTPFPFETDAKTGRQNLIGFPCNQSLKWSLVYDPAGNGGQGVVTATIGTETAVCNLDTNHKTDGATFDRFGILNVTKSADSGSEIWLDDVAIGDSPAETFERDPNWEGHQNRQIVPSKIVRPWFDFGWSDTHFAQGKGQGELGGQIFRGDCRYEERMACYGDRVGPLTLNRPLEASGKIVMRRGVSDSTTLFGFYHSKMSMQRNDSQSDGLPESVLGLHVEGPSREGFLVYPVLRMPGGGSEFGRVDAAPHIQPDDVSHDWTLKYDPQGAGGKGAIAVTLDGRAVTLELAAGDKARGATFDRFGIVTSWIDGNSQDVYWDDVSYTIAQE